MSAYAISLIRYPDWEPQLREALIEADPVKRAQKLATAEDAIYLRWQNMESGHSPEREAMDETCCVIQRLLVEVLAYRKLEV